MRALAGAVLVVAMALGVAQAEDPYPTRPVSMVVAFPPGGARRQHGAAGGGGARAHPEAAGGRGEQGRRGGRRGLPDRGEQQAGRLYGADGARQRVRAARGRQALRAPGDVHARSVHGHRAHQCRPVDAGGPRGHAVEDAEGLRRRRQEAAGRDRVQLVRPLRHGACADGDAHARVRHRSCGTCRRRRRPDDERDPRRSRPGRDDAGEPRRGPGEGGQAAAPRPHRDGAGGRLPEVPSFKSQGYDVEYTAWAGLVAPEEHAAARRSRSCATRRGRR